VVSAYRSGHTEDRTSVVCDVAPATLFLQHSTRRVSGWCVSFSSAIQLTKSYVINELGWVSLLPRLQLTVSANCPAALWIYMKGK
jgi:hypothetical protein